MRLRSALMIAVFSLSTPAFAKGGAARKAPPTKTPAKKRVAPPNAAHKKALAELMAGFKFGMTKDEVLQGLQKKIDDSYEEQIKATSDIAQQDRLRKEKKTELARIAGTYVAFEGTKTGWDVSIIENEFAHHTNEAMMERWENDGGRNNRRFFFFHDGKLWKMFISLDVSIIPEDKRNFDTLRAYMESKYGAGDVEGGTITWHAGEFEARAIDRLRDYNAIGLAIEDPKIRTEVLAEREAKKPPQHETSSVIKAVIDSDGTDHPDVKSDNSAVDAVIKAQGGGKK